MSALAQERSAEVIQLYPKKEDEKCSFCGATKAKSKHMISNKQGKFICDKCVVKAMEIVKPEPSKEK